MKKISLLLFAILLCTVRVEACFEAGERDSGYSELSGYSDTTNRNSDHAQHDAARGQRSSSGSMTVREAELAPSTPAMEGDASQNNASSASLDTFEDDASENFFDDDTIAYTTKDAQDSYRQIVEDQKALHQSFSENSHLPSEQLATTLEDLVYARDFWARHSDLYENFLRNHLKEGALTDVKKQRIIELIEACNEAKIAAEKYMEEMNAIASSLAEE